MSTALYSQQLTKEICASFKPDESLKEITEYWINGRDSSLVSKEYYSNGFLRKQQIFWQDTLRIESTFNYDGKGVLSSIDKQVKDNIPDSVKTSLFFLYDQNNNVYFERSMIFSLVNPDSFQVHYQTFTNYIYKDGLIIYSNLINDMADGGGIQTQSYHYEYDKKNRLKKTSVHNLGDPLDEYLLLSERFYDKKGNHINTIKYCNENGFDVNGNEIKVPCLNDTSFFDYNSKNQLLEERHHVKAIFIGSDQKIKIKYHYDKQGRLISIFNIIEEDRTLIYRRYFKY